MKTRDCVSSCHGLVMHQHLPVSKHLSSSLSLNGLDAYPRPVTPHAWSSHDWTGLVMRRAGASWRSVDACSETWSSSSLKRPLVFGMRNQKSWYEVSWVMVLNAGSLQRMFSSCHAYSPSCFHFSSLRMTEASPVALWAQGMFL